MYVDAVWYTQVVDANVLSFSAASRELTLHVKQGSWSNTKRKT